MQCRNTYKPFSFNPGRLLEALENGTDSALSSGIWPEKKGVRGVREAGTMTRELRHEIARSICSSLRHASICSTANW